MRNSQHTIGQELHAVILFVGSIWAVSLVAFLVPWLKTFGLVPRTLRGLTGIATMPFLHENLFHLIGNTIPLLVLLVLLAGSRARSWEIVIDIILLGGAFLWVVGRTAIHIGASGLIFGLASFLILAGFLEKRIIPLIIALLVGFLYGTSLLPGLVPHFGSSISWDGHLCGAIAGGVIAFALTHDRRARLEDSLTRQRELDT
jgi:membrane associated rhomboid family serine protease